MTQQMVGIIGLGNMGKGMAQSLLRAGYQVVGTDLGESQRQSARELGVKIVDDVKSLCAETDTIFLSLPMAKHVQAVVTGAGGIIESAQPQTLVIDTTTSEPDITVALAAQLAEHGHSMLDCPVSGGPSGAAAGSMVMVLGGEAESLERARPILEALTARIVHLGKSGNGHVAKLINNLLCATHLITTAEAVRLGQEAGLDSEALINGLNAGSGRSAISEVNFPRWILNDEYSSGFTMQLMRKDVRLASELIKKVGLDLPISQQAATIWKDSESTIPDLEDFNRIIKTAGLGE